ncbi:hypothetical protein ES702_02176 [subsurface metagenome]
MKIPIFMIFQFIGIISSWANKALEDGKVTAQEGLELVIALSSLLGVRTEFDISDYVPKVIEVEMLEEETDEAADSLSKPDFSEPGKVPEV